MDIRENTLPVLGPKGGEEEVDAIRQVIESGWWGAGPKVDEFEDKFAKLVGRKYAIAVTSASHGQDLVMKALRFKRIDVINPTISFIATAVIPLWNDCTTNIVDVDRRTLCIDPEDVARYRKPNSEVLIAVNMAGIPAPYAELRKVHPGYIIEDCAHSCYTPRAGLGGDIAVWSFQAVKTMPTGDGGMITTNDTQLYAKLKDMTWFGVSSTWSRVQNSLSGKPGYSWDYQIRNLGYKCYMNDLTAAIGLVQLKKLPGHLLFRRHIQQRYTNQLKSYIKPPPFSDTVQYYCARVPKEHRDKLIAYLNTKKIHTSIHFKPLHKHNILRQNRAYPIADDEWLKLISLPVTNQMLEEDIDYVIYWVKKFFEYEA